MNEINVRNEILESIDNTEMVTMESSIDVLMSMSAAYDKAVSIMEYSTADDLSMFSIFQEAEVAAGDTKTNAGAKNESIGYKILMFIPRLLKAFWEFIKKVWNDDIVPAAEQATKTVKSIPEAIREKIDSLLGKDEGSIKTVLAGLGLAAAALTGATAAVMAVNKKDEDFRNKVSAFVGNAKNFFKVLKDSDATPVWRISLKKMTITTNLALETIKDLSTTKFVQAFAEFEALPPNLDDYSAHIEKITNAVNEVRVLPIMLPEPKEYSFDDIAAYLKGTEAGIKELGPKIKAVTDNLNNMITSVKNLEGYDKDSAGDNPHAKEMQYVKSVSDKNLEKLKGLNQIKDQLEALCQCQSKIVAFTSNIGKEYDEYIALAKEASDKLTIDNANAIDNQLKDEDKAPEEGAEEKAAEEDTNTDDISDALADNLDNPPQRSSNGSSEQDEDTFEPAVNMDQHVDDVPEGEETVQESAELTEADIEINNHWYR